MGNFTPACVDAQDVDRFSKLFTLRHDTLKDLRVAVYIKNGYISFGRVVILEISLDSLQCLFAGDGFPFLDLFIQCFTNDSESVP